MLMLQNKKQLYIVLTCGIDHELFFNAVFEQHLLAFLLVPKR